MDQVIIPSPSGDDYVELARTRTARGRVFRKHILSLGELIHPKTGEKLQLDEAWYDQLKANFDAGVCDIVQVPLADAQNQHSEDPLRNLGEVIGVERDGNKVYSVVDIRDSDAAAKVGKTLLGASAFLSLDYTDTATGKKVGPALLHHCVTNRPYVTGLGDYEEVIAASADGTGDVIVLAQEETAAMTKEELLAQLKAEHGIDVAALEAQAGQRNEMSQLTAALTEALRPAGGTVSLTGGDGETVSISDVVGAVAELAEKNVSLSGTVGVLQKDAAEREVDGYIGVGRLLPKSRARAVTLVLSGDREGLEDFLAPENAPYVRLGDVQGAAPPQGEQRHTEDIDAEIMRLTSAPHTAHLFNGKK